MYVVTDAFLCRRKILLTAAIEIESDVFWMSTTSPGFRSIFASRSKAVKELISKDDPLPREGGDEVVEEMVKAVRRTVTFLAALKGKKGSKRKASEEGDVDDE